MRLIALLVAFVPALASAQSNKIAVLPTQFDESSRGQVPKLFDDYLLTAVQNNTQYEVIGQNDITTMLGFEQQKDMFDCDDTTCIADIGGALGVDKIVVVKIAKLGPDWIATAKLINIREASVEGRTNRIVSGQVKDLLRDVPNLVTELFAQAPDIGTEPETDTPPPPELDEGTVQRGRSDRETGVSSPGEGETAGAGASGEVDQDFGSGLRTAGTVMLIAGAVLAGVGGILFTAVPSGEDCTYDPILDEEDCTPSVLDIYRYAGAGFLVVVGLVVEGIGSKLRANGWARGQLNSSAASGDQMFNWLGFVLAGLTVAAPIYGFATGDKLGGDIWGWTAGIASSAVFFINAFAGITPEHGSVQVRPDVSYARTDLGEGAPTFGLSMSF